MAPAPADAAAPRAFEARRGRDLITVTGSLVMIGIGIKMVLTPEAFAEATGPGTVAAIGLGVTVLFVAGAAMSARRLLRPTIVLSLEPDALVLSPPWQDVLRLPWDQIVEVAPFGLGTKRLLGFRVHDAEPFITKLSERGQRQARANLRLGLPPFAVDLSTLRADAGEVEAAVRAAWRQSAG